MSPKRTAVPVDNARLVSGGRYDDERKTAPAGNRGLTRSSDLDREGLAHMVATRDDRRTAFLTIPLARVATPCCDLGPRYTCNRPAGHTGRHSYVWRNAGILSGRVRGVWR